MCKKHGGGAPQVKAKAAIAAEVFNWGLSDVHVDPGETLLRLVTQSAARAARYAEELEKAVEEHGFVAAMVGDSYGEHGKTGEYMRGLAQLESQERDRCANFATKAIAAGLAERQVRLAERQGELMVTMVAAALREAQVPEQYAAAFKVALAGQARALTV